MIGTLAPMKTSEQVRLPLKLTREARIVAAWYDESFPRWVARVVKEAVDRDMPKVIRSLGKRKPQGEAEG